MSLDTELLIDTVREYPVLYNTAHADYKNNRIKNKIWDSIAVIIGESDGDTLKTKWKNLRDAYSKHLRSNKTCTGQAAKLVERYKTWPWVKQMSFLRPFLEFAPTHSNVQNDLAVANTSHQETEASSSDIHPLPSHQHSGRIQSSKKQNKTQVDKIINFLIKRHTDFDDIDLVFLGYAKTIKKMTKCRQAKVKFQFAKIIMQSELEQAEETSLATDSRILQSPEIDRIFTESTPLNSPGEAGEDTNDSFRD